MNVTVDVTVNEYFYNFTVGGENRGYSYLYTDSSKLYSFTRFFTDNAVIFTNVFSLRLNERLVVACKQGDLDWVDLSKHPPNHFPGCAYPLLLAKADNTPYTYVQISEDNGSVINKTRLERTAADIVESQGGTVRRRFTMQNNTPIRIDWGGAISQLCSDGKESVRGTNMVFEIE